MGEVNSPKAVKFFASFLSTDDRIAREGEKEIERLTGPIQIRTDSELFSHTTYYEKEMGPTIMRHFVLFSSLGDRTLLPMIKSVTNGFEERTSINGQRVVNIDPGFVTLENVILATTKNFTHRIYLANGIYGDLTLIFHRRSYQTLPWTYPDYGSDRIIALFNEWRTIYRQELK